ncbi:MAG: flagellar export chaperone FlgN [Phycisphaerae bacterium]
MSRQVHELELLLQGLIDEHAKLLGHVDAHQAAMRTLDLKAMDAAVSMQEACRLRVNVLENKRRLLVGQIARAHRMTQQVTVAEIAALYPPSSAKLLSLRTKLKEQITQIQSRTHVAGRVASAVLGHLNTVVRLIAGAVEKAGLYTKQGVPQVSARIGVMEAVG